MKFQSLNRKFEKGGKVMKKMITIGVVILTMAFVGYTQAITRGNPFEELFALINGLDTRVAALEAPGGAGAERVVISDSVDLESTGDVVLESFDTSGRKRLDHHVEILVPGLTTDDLPAVTLYRRRVAALPPFSSPNEEFNAAFRLATLNERGPGSDMTRLRFVDGKILLRYRRDRFNPPGAATPTDVFYGLDGVGGTGDFRLVLIK